ncbi:hypothetical protein EC991_004307 [Linnemannia zychae]|nr:hypothetical protein EC991_004307 [Linnemannia zychae]
MTSTRSAGASPQRFQLQQIQQQQYSCPPLPGTGSSASPSLQNQTLSEKQPAPRSMMGNLFGMVSKRRSFPSVEEEDPTRRFGYGGQQYYCHGFEVTGTGSQRNSMIVLDDGDEDLDDLDEDSDLEDDDNVTAAPGEEGGRVTPAVGKVRKRRQILVNDYGFICEPEDNNNNIINNGGSGGESQQGNVHGLGGHGPAEVSSGSMVSELAARLSEPSSFLAEHERKRHLKKQQEFNRASEAKWIQAITHLQPDQVKKLTKFKKLARGGVPPSVRGRVWQFLANVDHYREQGLFQELLSRGHLPIHDVIARDVHRCYPDHVHFRDGMGGTGQEDLHSILKAYAHYKPSVGYCQGMGRLVGMMLMQMPVEEAFWLLVATLEGGYLNDYFTPTLRQLRIDAVVFERLLKAQDPRLAHHLETNDVSPITYITPWFLTLFTMSLPWASVLRVWDVFYFDGVKTLFRIGLGILQICRTTLLEDCPSSAECMDFLLHVPLDRLGPEVLLDRTAFRIRLRRESLEKMSLLTAGEMDAKEAGRKVAATASVKSGSTTDKEQQQQQQQQEEDEDKKRPSSKRSMLGTLRGVKATAASTTAASSTTIMTTTTTTSTMSSTPPTSATSIRTTKTHATTSSRSDNVVTFVEPPPRSRTITTTSISTIFTMRSAQTTAAPIHSDMNQETSSLPPAVDPDHDNRTDDTYTSNSNPNIDFIQVNVNNISHDNEDEGDCNAAVTTASEETPTAADLGSLPGEEKAEMKEEVEGKHTLLQPLLIATSDNINKQNTQQQ